MLFTNIEKRKLKKDLFNSLTKNKNIVSVTLVGSFWENNRPKDFSDIDIVIILKRFNKKDYQECIKKITRLNLKKYNLGHLKTLINPTFGPLKFNTENNIVFHTMIYDIKGHIDHVLKSPFTCFDWERSSNFTGKSLKEIFPVGKIQLIDFFKSRRGINSYLNNLKKNHISYQKYIFKNSSYKLINKKFKIDNRHKLEFSFHLCKFLIINFYKFKNQKNKIPSGTEIKSMFKIIFKNNYNFYLKNFILFKKFKKDYDEKLTFNQIHFLKSFVNKFQEYLKSYKKKDMILLRHARTKHNDGSFLGIGRNPSIINKKSVSKKLNYLKKIKQKIVYSSTLKRSLETAQTFENLKDIVSSNHLVEKNYGTAEGLNFLKLKKKYPSIISKWDKKKDPRFPFGENDKDILKRIKLFDQILKKDLRNNPKKKVIIIVTHNALLRCYLGNVFDIPKYLWIKIPIKHIQPLNFIIKDNKIIPNIDRVNLFNNLKI